MKKILCIFAISLIMISGCSTSPSLSTVQAMSKKFNSDLETMDDCQIIQRNIVSAEENLKNQKKAKGHNTAANTLAGVASILTLSFNSGDFASNDNFNTNIYAYEERIKTLNVLQDKYCTINDINVALLNDISVLEEKAKNGDAKAQYSLATVYYAGHGVKQNYEEAFKWTKLSAEQGNIDAQYNLGSMYYQGHGVRQNYTEALKWFKVSADKGDAGAQYNLGLMYGKGHGVAKNNVEAFKWITLSAEKGNADAQLVLGMMYYQGLGVSKNAIEAKKWYKKACENGNKSACNEI